MRVFVSSQKFPDDAYGEDALLMGQWCLADDVDGTVLKRGTKCIQHPWVDPDRLARDYEKIRELYDAALAQMSNRLGQTHGIKLSERAWEIFLGTWLRIFINMAAEHYLLLRQVEDSHGPSTLVLHSSERHPIAQDTRSFIVDLQQPAWNEDFVRSVVEVGFPSWKIEVQQEEQETDQGHQPSSPSRLQHIKKRVTHLVSLVDAAYQKNKGIILHGLGMPWQRQLGYELRSGMLPHIMFPAFEGSIPINRDLPDINIGPGRLEMVIGSLLWAYLPSIFLEDFKALRKHIDRYYPAKPKHIMTAVAYYSDDPFKLFTAQAVDQGCKYSILQHGGAFGTAQINDEEELKVKTADFFHTWGWSTPFLDGARAQHIPGGSFLLKSIEPVTGDPEGMMVLPVSEWTLHTFRLFSAPMSFRQLDYVQEIITLCKLLPARMQAHFKLRLVPHDRGWHLVERFKRAGLGDALLPSPGRFVTDLPKSRLAIINTNSTTMLEALSANLPTLLLLRSDLWPVRDSALPYYNALAKAGILHETPQALVEHLASLWEDPRAWWEQAEVQQARTAFTREFARPTSHVHIKESVLHCIHDREFSPSVTHHAH